MQKLILFVAILLFIGCDEKISFIDIEENINHLESLNSQEREIAQMQIKHAKENNYRLITTKELKDKLESGGDLQIIAAIPRGIYTLGFIKNAKNFEFSNNFSGIWEKDTKGSKDKFIDFLGDRKKEIIFYDNGENTAITAAIWAKKLGYENVAILIGGFKGWKERDFEISFDIPTCCQI